MSGEQVTTWADGFGVWHCRVSFPAPGYGPTHLAQHATRIRAKARRAIRREITARQGPQRFTVRLQVDRTDLDSCNVARSITFGERPL